MQLLICIVVTLVEQKRKKQKLLTLNALLMAPQNPTETHARKHAVTQICTSFAHNKRNMYEKKSLETSK